MSSVPLLDEINLKIVRHLWDGRKPYADIAKNLNINTATVRRRVDRLVESGVLQIIGLVDPKAVAGHRSAFMAFKVEPDKVPVALEQIGDMKNTVAAGWISGRFDIMAIVMFNEEYSHEKLVLEELPKIEGLLAIETFYVERGVNWQLRYVL
jgi:Lrp/AsnC family transcriptional regulator for asnA, asnC and gidA